jgi:hypothetical protein
MTGQGILSKDKIWTAKGGNDDVMDSGHGQQCGEALHTRAGPPRMPERVRRKLKAVCCCGLYLWPYVPNFPRCAIRAAQSPLLRPSVANIG